MISFFIIAHTFATFYHYTDEVGFAGISQTESFVGTLGRTESTIGKRGVFFTTMRPPCSVSDRTDLLQTIYSGTDYENDTSRCKYVIEVQKNALQGVQEIRENVYFVETNELRVPVKHQWSRLDQEGKEIIKLTNLTRMCDISGSQNSAKGLFLDYCEIRVAHEVFDNKFKKNKKICDINRDQEAQSLLKKMESAEKKRVEKNRAEKPRAETSKVDEKMEIAKSCRNASDREYVLKRLDKQFHSVKQHYQKEAEQRDRVMLRSKNQKS